MHLAKVGSIGFNCSNFSSEMNGDFPSFRFIEHLMGSFAMTLERLHPVDDSDTFGNRQKPKGPVECRITTTNNDHALTGEIRRIPYRVKHRYIFHICNITSWGNLRGVKAPRPAAMRSALERKQLPLEVVTSKEPSSSLAYATTCSSRCTSGPYLSACDQGCLPVLMPGLLEMLLHRKCAFQGTER